jgi:hypothetical protein
MTLGHVNGWNNVRSAVRIDAGISYSNAELFSPQVYYVLQHLAYLRHPCINSYVHLSCPVQWTLLCFECRPDSSETTL